MRDARSKLGQKKSSSLMRKDIALVHTAIVFLRIFTNMSKAAKEHTKLHLELTNSRKGRINYNTLETNVQEKKLGGRFLNVPRVHILYIIRCATI